MSHRQMYRLEGVDCAVCAARIQEAVELIDGVGSSTIDLMSSKLEIVTDHGSVENLEQRVREVIDREEPGARLSSIEQAAHAQSGFSLFLPARIAIALAILGMASLVDEPWYLFLMFVSYAVSGYDVLFRAVRNVFRGNLFDEHFLMTIATVGAFIIGEHAEAVAVMAFYQAGEFFQDLAVRRSRSSIATLMDIKPSSATIMSEGKSLRVTLDRISVGDTLLIKAGEKVPVDAIVRSGSSTLDTKALTGESVPRRVEPGDEIISGSLNGNGVLHAEATTTYEDSTVATILRLVEESSMRKADTERFITRFARYYTPIVVLLAATIALIPPLAGYGSFSDWMYRALVFLVISCPCALVISVPLGFFGGIGGLARMGVLVKGGNFVQALAKTRTLVFDKTGTLTEGRFTVSKVDRLTDDMDEQAILDIAASVERHSNHPIAQAIARAASSIIQVDSVKEEPGLGIQGIADDEVIRVGTLRFMQGELSEGTRLPGLIDDTDILVAIGERIIGRISVSDTVKPEARSMVDSLRKFGIHDMVILSGDSDHAVAQVATAVGIESFFGRLLPQDKLAHVERLLSVRTDRSALAFVGDGVNDAPVLARADVGIAMGKLGSDAALEAADVVIMTDDLSRIPSAIEHARRTMTIVKQNIVFALSVKVMVMALGAAGFASMWLAVFADTGVALIAIVNALRSLRHT